MYKTSTLQCFVLRNQHRNFGGKLTKVVWWIVNNARKIVLLIYHLFKYFINKNFRIKSLYLSIFI